MSENQQQQHSHFVNLPKLAEIQMDDQTETTIKTLINYVTVLEQNQKELIKMINTVVVELPDKIEQKVNKYMKYYQQNVVDKQLEELEQSVDKMTEITKQQQSECNIDINQLNDRLQVLEENFNYTQMSSLFEDIAQIRQMLGQLIQSL